MCFLIYRFPDSRVFKGKVTGHEMPWQPLLELRRFLRAYRLCDWAARMEFTARRWVCRIRRLTLELDAPSIFLVNSGYS